MINNSGELVIHQREGQPIQVANTPFGNIIVVPYKDVALRNQEISALEPVLVIIPFGIVEEPSNWPLQEHLSIPFIAQTFSKIINSYIIAINSVSESLYKQWSENANFGISIAVNPSGEILQQTSPCKEKIKFVQITLEHKKSEHGEKSSNWEKAKLAWKSFQQRENETQ